MLIKAASKTDVGKRRSLNEDKIGMYEKENVYLVCDGMGGQVAGSLASDIAVETITAITTQYQLGATVLLHSAFTEYQSTHPKPTIAGIALTRLLILSFLCIKPLLSHH